jgi:hypothetical protein
MKYNILKSTAFLVSAMSILLLASCVKKNEATYTDFGQVQDFVILTGAGTGNFKASNIAVNTSSTDTIRKTITVDLASKTNDNGPVTVTVGFDNPQIASFNSGNGTSYVAFPTSAYKIINTSVTIPAGQHYATTTVEIYQNKLDPTVSYLLPISILDAGGKKLSSNQNTIFFNVIGNVLAGTYRWDFSRFNSSNSDTTATPAAGSFTNQTVVVSPVTATSLLLPESYMQTFVDASAGVTLSFTNNNGTLSNFSVSLDATTLKNISAGQFTIATAPVLVGYKIVGTAATKYVGSSFRIYMVLINSSGGTRTVIDNYIKLS